MSVDLDQSGSSWQKAKTYLGPSLGWVDTQVGPTRLITVPGTYLILPGDSTIFVNAPGIVTILLPDVKAWIQEPAYQPATGFSRLITVKDFGGNAGSYPIAIQPFGTQKIDGQQMSVSLNQAHQSVGVLPTNDLTGWWISNTGWATTGGSGTGPITSVAPPFTTPSGQLNITLDPNTLTIDGSNRLATDPDLTALAQLTGTNTIYYRSGVSAWSPVTMGANMSFAGGVLNSVSGFADAPSDGSTYGRLNAAWAKAQPLSGDLTSLAAASAINTIYYRSAANTWGPVTIGTGLTFTSGTLDAPTFSSSVKGEVPASGGGTANFLRADGVWSVPPGGASSIVINTTTITGGANNSFLYDNSGTVGERTIAQTTAALTQFTSTLQGMAPASGGGTANFLRADGVWSAPPGGVVSLNGLTGALSVTAGTAIAVTPSGSTVQVSALPFGAAAQGIVPASGGGTANYLRADGTWAAPSGSGNVTSVGTPTNGQWAQWTGATTIQGVATASTPWVQKAGDTMTGPLTINAGDFIQAGGDILIKKTIPTVNVCASGTNDTGTFVLSNTSLSAYRWAVQMTGDAETGSNAGSNLQVIRYSDAASVIDAPLAINRATGLATVVADPTAALGVATKQYVDARAVAPPGYLGGLTLTYQTVNTLAVVAPGGATSDDAAATAVVMVLPGNIVKATTGTWVVGNNQSGLDTGTIAASTWYYVWLIERTDTGVVDVLFSLQPVSPTMPASYTKKRRIGAFATDAGSAIINFVQQGDEFVWVTPIAVYSNATLTAGANAIACGGPPSIKTDAIVTFTYTNATINTYLTLASGDCAAGGANSPVGNFLVFVNVANGYETASHVRVRTNSNNQITVYASVSGPSFYLISHGWVDNRGK
jgi:hypothetical protein